MSDVTAFEPLPSVTLRDDEVHIWDIAISEFSDRQDSMGPVLAPHEADRAARFRFARDRSRYVVSHWFVRKLLADYLAASPQHLSFVAGRWGKPALQGAAGVAPLEFNLSHSGDVALLAVSRGRQVGVDVEEWNGNVAYDRLAAFCFSPTECRELAALPQERKAGAFFAGWTRKEAFIKATGVGVDFGLDYFDVSLSPGDARLLADRRDVASVAAWGMQNVPMPHGYSAAIVARGTEWSLRRFSLRAARANSQRPSAVA